MSLVERCTIQSLLCSLCGKSNGDMSKVYISFRISFSHLFHCYDKGYHSYIEYILFLQSLWHIYIITLNVITFIFKSIWWNSVTYIYEQILKVTVTCDFFGNRCPIGIFIETLSNEIGTYLFDFHTGKK